MAYAGTEMGADPFTHQPYTKDVLVAAQFAEHSRAGWTFSLGAPIIDPSNLSETYDHFGNPLQQCVVGGDDAHSCCYIDRLRIMMADGSTHEFRSTDQPICYTTSGGVSPTPPDDLYSVDGAKMHYKRSTNTLYLPDGSYWTMSTGSYFDRNGNILQGSTGDTLGRTLPNPLGNTGNDYPVSFPGVGGGTLTYTFHWRKLSDALTVLPQNLPSFSDYNCVRFGTNCTGQYLFTSDTGFTPGIPIYAVGGYPPFDPFVLYQIDLPNQQYYRFTYDKYAEIDQVFYPTGGYEKFAYAQNEGNPNGSQIYAQANRGVTTRWVSAKGDGSDLVQWQYSGTSADTSPDNTSTGRSVYQDYYGSRPWSYGDTREKMPTEEDVLNASGQLLRRKLTQWDITGSNWTGNGPFNVQQNANRDARVSKEVEILLDTGTGSALAKTTIHNYDLTYQFSVGAIETSVVEYDWVALTQSTAQTVAIGAVPLGNVLRTQETTNLLLDSNISQTVRNAYLARNLVGLVTSSRVKDAAGNIVAQSSTSYDEYSLMNPGSVASWTDPQTTYRGNATTTSRWLNTTSSYLQTHATYDQFGSVRTSTDAKGNQSSMDYLSSYQYAFPTTTTTAVPDPSGTYGSSLAFSSTTNFDFNTGRALSSTDANLIMTTAEYNDVLNRPTRSVNASGNSAQNQSPITYDDPNHLVTGKSDLSVFNDSGIKAETVYDGIGRTTESRKYESSANYAVTQTQYDAMGRPYKVSNPFRPLAPYYETPVWTTSVFDPLGRVLSVTTPDVAVVQTEYAASTSGTLGTMVLVTDQAGKQRISKTNALGQLTDVWEVTGVDPATESITFPGHAEVTAGYHTSYSYNVLGSLLAVTQGSQTRTFTYDSLNRLTSSTNPENGTISYQYDSNGNLIVKTDARGASAHYAYDALNRVTRRWYNGSSDPNQTTNNSPALPSSVAASDEVKFFYDSASLPSGSPSFDRGYASGRLVAVTYGGGSAGTYRGYDAMGRVLRQYQQTDSVNYLTEATYYASGAMQSEIYPAVPGAGDRRTVTYTNDTAGRLASLWTSATSYAPAAGVASIGYTSHGGLSTETYGSGLIHQISYNNRLQPTEIKLGTSGNPTSVFDLTYDYGTTTNDGNVKNIGYSGGGLSYTQSFGYDSLNRLTTSTENSGASWSQTNAYDRYGNRWIDLGGNNQSLYFNSPTNNRISGWSYDNAGNLLNDGVHNYVFDAENKISKVDTVSAYVYNGEGQRVRKLVNENLRFIYGIGGKELAEFSGSGGVLQKEYIYGAGGLLATIEPTAVNSNGTRYTTSDNLGTPRAITNSSAAVISRHDYKPFGEELSAGIGGRTSGIGYGADGIRQKFTSKERDIETGLDYFLARYYSSTQGRFTSPDEFRGGPDELYVLGSGDEEKQALPYAEIATPQSLNKYQYAYNNPLRYIDLDGHDVIGYELITSGPNQVPNTPHPEVPDLKELGPQDTSRGGYFALNLKVNFDAGDNIDDYKHQRAAFILDGQGGVNEMRNGVAENPSKNQTVKTGQSRIVFDEPGIGVQGAPKSNIGTGKVEMALVAGEYNKKTKDLSSNLAYYKVTLVFNNGQLDKKLSSAVTITRQQFIDLTKKQLPKNRKKQSCPECALQ